MGKKHDLTTVTLQESTRVFQQWLVYCTELRPQISCLAIIQSYLHPQDPSLFHLSGSSHMEQKQLGVGKRQDPVGGSWHQAETLPVMKYGRQARSIWRSSTGFLPKSSLNLLLLGMKELCPKYYSWHYDNDALQ